MPCFLCLFANPIFHVILSTHPNPIHPKHPIPTYPSIHPKFNNMVNANWKGLHLYLSVFLQNTPLWAPPLNPTHSIFQCLSNLWKIRFLSITGVFSLIYIVWVIIVFLHFVRCYTLSSGCCPFGPQPRGLPPGTQGQPPWCAGGIWSLQSGWAKEGDASTCSLPEGHQGQWYTGQVSPVHSPNGR